MSVAVGQFLEVTIERLSLGGDGIARVRSKGPGEPSDLVVFVPFAAPGDRVEVRIIERKKTFARAEIRRVIEGGPERTAPPCPSYFTPVKTAPCGGCNFQHLRYPGQIGQKVTALRETLQRIAGIAEPTILPAISASEGSQWRYRNKIQVPFGRDGRGEIVAGFYAPGSHRIVPLDECAIQSEEMMAVLRFVRGRLKEWKLEPYDQKLHRGWLRHLFIRQERSSRNMLVAFVTATEAFSKEREWVQEFQKDFPLVSGVLQNVNLEQTNVILGRKWRTVYGQDHLVETLEGLGAGGRSSHNDSEPALPRSSSVGGPLKLRVSASSFFQVNTGMAALLYRAARDAAVGEHPGEMLLDLYCGVGGIGLACAPHFQKILGIEEAPSSIKDAEFNCGLNQISNAEFKREDVETFLSGFRRDGIGGPLRVVIDPPRAGCAEGVLRQLLRLSPERIVYVSCEPSTLARDVKILASGGYGLAQVQPVDLFPQSAHVESVSLLTKLS